MLSWKPARAAQAKVKASLLSLKPKKGSLGKIKAQKREKKGEKILVEYVDKKFTRKVLINPVRIRGMSLAPFSKNSDDLSITIFMEEKCQEPGTKYNSGENMQVRLG